MQQQSSRTTELLKLQVPPAELCLRCRWIYSLHSTTPHVHESAKKLIIDDQYQIDDHYQKSETVNMMTIYQI